MKILVTCAVQSEIGAGLGAPDFSGDIFIVRTGIGMRRPQDELKKALAGPTDICISSGLAGSLREQYPIGSIVVARGIKSDSKETIVSCDGTLVDAAVRCGATLVDFFFTSTGIANSEAERSHLVRSAEAIDMESFHILTEAQRSAVPAVAIRAISDTPERKLPIDFSRTVTSCGDVAWPRMIGELIKNPLKIPAFVRFGLDTSAAIRNLTTFLDRYVKFLMMNYASVRIAAEQMSR
jgi:hypothetical protein